MSVSRGWKELTPGLIALAALLGVVLAILLFARVGAVRGKTFTLYVRVDEARGIMRGSEVWLAGQVVGRVENVRLLPPGRFPEARVLIESEISERHRGAIRRDSDARIGSGGQIIGNPGVALTIGSTGGRIVEDGDTIVALGATDVEALVGRASEAARELPMVMGDLRQIAAKVKAPEGSLGAIAANRESFVAPTLTRLTRLRERVERGRGALARAMSDQALRQRLAGVLAGADSVQALLSSPETSLGRFRRDSTLVRNLESIQSELGEIRGMIDRSEGTVGRVINDSALVNSVAQIQAELQALIADVKENPLRYISF
jgi:phospholipid/cholesterol/gamma-HCH transport system substrate-binding protein